MAKRTSQETSVGTFVATKKGIIEVYSGSDARTAEVMLGDTFVATEEMSNGIYYLGKLKIKNSFKLSPGLSGKDVSKLQYGNENDIVYLLRKDNIDGNDNFFAQFKKIKKYEDGGMMAKGGELNGFKKGDKVILKFDIEYRKGNEEVLIVVGFEDEKLILEKLNKPKKYQMLSYVSPSDVVHYRGKLADGGNMNDCYCYEDGGNFEEFLNENEENDNWYDNNWFYGQYKDNKFTFQVENESGDFILEPMETTIYDMISRINKLKDGERAVFSNHESIERKQGNFIYHYGDGEGGGGKRKIVESKIKDIVIDGIRSDVRDYYQQMPIGSMYAKGGSMKKDINSSIRTISFPDYFPTEDDRAYDWIRNDVSDKAQSSYFRDLLKNLSKKHSVTISNFEYPNDNNNFEFNINGAENNLKKFYAEFFNIKHSEVDSVIDRQRKDYGFFYEDENEEYAKGGDVGSKLKEKKITIKDIKNIYSLIEDNEYDDGSGYSINERKLDDAVYDQFEDTIHYNTYKKIVLAYKQGKNPQKALDSLGNKMKTGGGVDEENKTYGISGIVWYVTKESAGDKYSFLANEVLDKDEFDRYLDEGIEQTHFDINIAYDWQIVPAIYKEMSENDRERELEYEEGRHIIGYKLLLDNQDSGFESRLPYDDDDDEYAKGGGVGRTTEIKGWYTKKYSTDDLGEQINDNITFRGLWAYMNQGYDVYEVLGVGDSLVRERVFEKLSEILGVDYDVVYNKWLRNSKYANGGNMNDDKSYICTYEIGGL